MTQGGQVVRSPIDDAFRPTGRSTMGVKFVTPKAGDSVAVVARRVEKAEEVEEAVDEAIEAAGGDPEAAGRGARMAGCGSGCNNRVTTTHPSHPRSRDDRQRPGHRPSRLQPRRGDRAQPLRSRPWTR